MCHTLSGRQTVWRVQTVVWTGPEVLIIALYVTIRSRSPPVWTGPEALIITVYVTIWYSRKPHPPDYLVLTKPRPPVM